MSIACGDRSAPGSRMFGALPPSSSTVRVICGAAWAMICPPTFTEPVKLARSMSGLRERRSPMAGPPATRLTTPGGRSASCRMRKKAIVESAPCGDGHRDHGAAGGQRAAELPRQQVQRVVVGGDRGDDTDRLAHQEAGAGDRLVVRRQGALPAAVGAGAGDLGVPGQRLDRTADLQRAGQRDRRADRVDHGLDELVEVLGDGLDDAGDRAAAVQRGEAGPGPGVERAARSGDGRVDLGGARGRDAADELLGRGVDGLEDLVARTLLPLAVEVDAAVVQPVGRGHLKPSLYARAETL